MDARLLWLAAGTFAIGVESFAIPSLLPQIAEATGTSLAQAGTLVTAFALANALGAPVLAALTGAADRRRVLVAAALAVALGALAAAASGGFAGLMAARVGLALASGLYTATAQATGVALSPPDHRARAIAVIVGGTTLAVAFGAPLGGFVGGLAGWRASYLMVAALALVAALAVRVMLPSGLRGPALPLRERLAVAALPGVAPALLTTVLVIAGAFTLIVFLAALATDAAGLRPGLVPALLLAFGIGAAAGNVAGGQLADRVGARRTVVGAVALTAALQLALSAVVHLPAPLGTPLLFGLTLLWGVAGWAFAPAQASRLLGLAGAAAPLALALNNSALFLGIAAGSLAGGAVLRWGSAADLGWVGALLALAALGVVLAGRRAPVGRTGLV